MLLFSEFRHGARALLRVPSLTAISVLTVALGAGAGTALFSVVKAVLLNPLPYTAADRIAWIAEVSDSAAETEVAYRNFLDWREQNHSFAGIAAYGDGPATVTAGDVPQSTHVAIVSEDFFDVMGAQALIGRTFSAAEQVVGSPPVAVIGYGLWQRAFAGDPAIIGRTLHISGAAPTVIGIIPSGFMWPEKTELWMPMTTFGDPGLNVRTGHNWRAVGRLQAGVPMAKAQADISAIERRIKKEHHRHSSRRTRQWSRCNRTWSAK